MPDDLSSIEAAELERRVAAIRERMRPLEQDLAALRVQRDVLLTEMRRRERLAHRTSRADLKTAMKEGQLPTVADLVAGTDSGSLDEYVFNLKTGGEVKLGFPGARLQSVSFTDGAKITQAGDLAQANSHDRILWRQYMVEVFDEHDRALIQAQQRAEGLDWVIAILRQ